MPRNPIKLLGDNRANKPMDGRFGPIGGAVLSGGSWPLPLANAQHYDLSLVAEAQSTDPAHSSFRIDFTRVADFRALWLGNTNFSLSAEMELTGWLDEARNVVSVPTVRFPVYPAIAYTRTLPFRARNWWSGRPLPEDLEGLSQNAFRVFPTLQRARSMEVRILDPKNRDGAPRFGRLLVQDGWIPSQNYERGARLGLDSGTTFEKTMSGAEVPDVQEAARLLKIGFNYLSDQEALDRGFELVRRAMLAPSGGEILVIDDSSPINLHRLSFLARPLPVSEWERPSSLFGNIAFELKERLP